MQFRDFYYLNRTSIDDYLSQLQGYAEDEIEVSDGRTNKAKAGADVVVNIGGEVDHSWETKKRAKVTDRDRFNKLYDLLKRNKKTDLKKFKKGQIYEFDAVISIPEIVEQLQLVKNWIPNAADLLSKELQSQEQEEEASGLRDSLTSSFTQKLFDSTKIPIFLTPDERIGFQLYSNLDLRWLQIDLPDWREVELTFLARAKKIIPRGHSKTLSVLPGLENLENATDAQKKAIRTSQKSTKDFKIEITGPAVEFRIVGAFE